MSSYPTTLLPPDSIVPFSDIDQIIFKMWDDYLEVEFTSDRCCNIVLQRLELTAAVIDYWEEKLTEVNMDEIRERRSSSD